jgi:hypothetical protein
MRVSVAAGSGSCESVARAMARITVVCDRRRGGDDLLTTPGRGSETRRASTMSAREGAAAAEALGRDESRSGGDPGGCRGQGRDRRIAVSLNAYTQDSGHRRGTPGFVGERRKSLTQSLDALHQQLVVSHRAVDARRRCSRDRRPTGRGFALTHGDGLAQVSKQRLPSVARRRSATFEVRGAENCMNRDRGAAVLGDYRRKPNLPPHPPPPRRGYRLPVAPATRRLRREPPLVEIELVRDRVKVTTPGQSASVDRQDAVALFEALAMRSHGALSRRPASRRRSAFSDRPSQR